MAHNSSSSSSSSTSTSTDSDLSPDFVVRHGEDHSRMFGEYFNNEVYSDLDLIVGEKRFKVHKFILKVKSEYFRTLLTNGMSESNQNEISIGKPNVDRDYVIRFEKLLRYVYSGEMKFNGTDETIEMLVMANEYLFAELQKSIGTRLEAILSTGNFCSIYSAAFACSAVDLKAKCLGMSDSKPSEILFADGLSNLDMYAFNEIINRESFKPIQCYLFNAISKWIAANQDKDASQLLSNVRLEQMPIGFLIKTVRPSNFFPESRISDAATAIFKQAEIGKPVSGRIQIEVDLLREGALMGRMTLSNICQCYTIARVKDQIRVVFCGSWGNRFGCHIQRINSLGSLGLYYQDTLLHNDRALGSYFVPNGAVLVARY